MKLDFQLQLVKIGKKVTMICDDNLLAVDISRSILTAVILKSSNI